MKSIGGGCAKEYLPWHDQNCEVESLTQSLTMLSIKLTHSEMRWSFLANLANFPIFFKNRYQLSGDLLSIAV